MPCVLCYVCSRGCQAEVGVWCRRKGWGTESPLPVEEEGAVLLPGLEVCVLYPGVYWELVLGTPAAVGSVLSAHPVRPSEGCGRFPGACGALAW